MIVPRAAPVTVDSERAGAIDWLAEAAVASVTVVTATAVSRLFVDASFLRDVLAMALAVHVVAAAARRARLTAVSSALVSTGCFGITVTVLRYGDTAWFVLPTADTVAAANDHLAVGWSVLNAGPAPVEPVAGLVLATGAALAVCAFLADTAAFRWHTAISAVAPASAVYAFAALAGSGDDAVMHGALFSGAVGAVMVSLWLRKRRADAWIESKPGHGAVAMARAAVVALLLAVAAGTVVGPGLPGARAEPWVDLANFEITDAAPWIDSPHVDPEPWGDFRGVAATPGGPAGSDGTPGGSSGSADGTRVLVSPLVQVRSRLVGTSDRELFIVEVPEDERQYWRLTSLDSFDGDGWRARSKYEDADAVLATTLGPSSASSPLVQRVSLTGLGNSYLPAAFEVRRVVDDGGVGLEYESASGSLIKARLAALEGPAEFTYSVESTVPEINNPDMLSRVQTSVLDPGFRAANTQVPDDMSTLVAAEAQRITSTARSDYQRALLLQDYFRLDGGFRYDLLVHANGGIDGLEEFLFEVRAGYCQQFASAYAAMARSVGLPTRVAVGFTWGEWDPERGEKGAYVVRGEHAHAWPEVYFAGTGWVRFEPTPGRGAPGDFAVTGHVADQAGMEPDAAEPVADGPEPFEEPAGATLPAASPPAADGAGDGSASSATPGRSEPAGSAGAASGWSAHAPRALLVGIVALAALGLVLYLMPVLRRLHRRRSRDLLANDPAGLIDLWWGEALQALHLARLGPEPFETPLELATRVASVSPAVGPIEELAGLATYGRYARDTPQSMAARAAVVASLVISGCRRQASPGSRLAAAVDPSSVFCRRPRQ